MVRTSIIKWYHLAINRYSYKIKRQPATVLCFRCRWILAIWDIKGLLSFGLDLHGENLKHQLFDSRKVAAFHKCRIIDSRQRLLDKHFLIAI